jgi:hypothetical protein
VAAGVYEERLLLLVLERGERRQEREGRREGRGDDGRGEEGGERKGKGRRRSVSTSSVE